MATEGWERSIWRAKDGSRELRRGEEIIYGEIRRGRKDVASRLVPGADVAWLPVIEKQAEENQRICVHLAGVKGINGVRMLLLAELLGATIDGLVNGPSKRTEATGCGTTTSDP